MSSWFGLPSPVGWGLTCFAVIVLTGRLVEVAFGWWVRRHNGPIPKIAFDQICTALRHGGHEGYDLDVDRDWLGLNMTRMTMTCPEHGLEHTWAWLNRIKP